MTFAWRLSGAGNDFLALVEPELPPAPERVAAWCRRGVSLGADGVFVLRRHSGAIALEHFNPDGATTELCLNGARCAVQLAAELGWGDAVELDTGAGRVPGRRLDATRTVVEVAPPEQDPTARDFPLENAHLCGWLIRVGVPHVVVPWPESLAECPVGELGPGLRAHPLVGPAGANAHFVRWPERQRLELRSFERGVEAETLACGTGTLAGVAAGIAVGALAFPVEAHTASGFVLTVAGEEQSGRVASWSLAGDARILGRVEIRDEAELLPSVPSWS